MNMQNEIDERSIVPAPKDIVASIIATVLICGFNILVKFFTNFGAVLPDTLLLILCGFVAIISLIAFNFLFGEYGLKYGQLLQYTVLIAIVGVGFIIALNLFAVLLDCCELVQGVEAYEKIYSSINSNIKNEMLFVTILCLLIVVYIWLHKRYVMLENAKKKELIESDITTEATKMSSHIISSFESFSVTVNDLLKKLEFDTAVTSTIIPFSIDKERGILKTYLITNSSYPDYTWMFPGGHVKFGENESPESVAKSRAKDEAGLDVSLVDLYHSFDLLSEDENENIISNMTVFNPPHYLYLFKLDKSARCFEEKGHEYHIDAVYVGKVEKSGTNKGANHRLYIPLPLKLVSPEEINQACYKALHSYYIKYCVKNSEQKNIPDYVEKMLYATYKDFVIFAEENL